MAWSPAKKVILNVKVIRINQDITKEISGVALPETIGFEWEKFVLSVTRTRGMQAQVEGLSLERRQRLIESYGLRIADAIDVFVDETTHEFAFSDGILILPDDERPSFAGNVGAAVADLVMESMGFQWRANAAELKLRAVDDNTTDKKKKKTPDYVYDPGSRHGFESGSVVVVEAKGSLSTTEALEAPVTHRARSAYKEQVEGFVGTDSQGLFVASGFAIAFGAVPGAKTSRIALASPQTVPVGRRPVSASAAAIGGAGFLQMAQAQEKQQPMIDHGYLQQVQTPQYVPAQEIRRGGRGGGGGDDGEGRHEGERAQPSGRIAYANYENVFLLCGARNAAAFLRNILSGASEDSVNEDALFQDFWLLDSPEPILTAGFPPWRHHFGIYEPSAVTILRSAADNRSAPPQSVEIVVAPTGDPTDAPGREFFMQGDGLAYVDWPGRPAKLRRWDLNKGDWA